MSRPVMLALSNTHPLQTYKRFTLYSSVWETQIQTFLPSAMSVNDMEGNTTLNHNLQELTQSPETFCTWNVARQPPRELIKESIFMNYCDSTKAKFPVTQSRNCFLNGAALRTIRYSSHSFLPQERNNYSTFSKTCIPIFQNSLTPLAIFNNFVLRNNDNISLHDTKRNYGDTEHVDKNSQMQFFMRTPNPVKLQSDPSCNTSYINIDTEMTKTESDLKRLKEDRTNHKLGSKQHNPYFPTPARKKLRHSIASILSVSPGQTDCLVRENIYKNNDNDISNIDNSNSSNSSDIFVDDDIGVSSSNEHVEDERNTLLRDLCNTLKRDATNNPERSSICIHTDIDTQIIVEETKQRSPTNSKWNTLFHDNASGDMKNEFLENLEFLRNSADENRVCKNAAFTPRLTHNHQKGIENLIHDTNQTHEVSNAGNTTDEDIPLPLLISNIPDLATELLLPNTQTALSASSNFQSSADYRTVLPPIQTLCLPYYKDGINKRSAFKPIRKLAPISQNVQHFSAPYGNWTGSSTLSRNADPSNNNSLERAAAVINYGSQMHPFIQRFKGTASNNNKPETISMLQQKNSFYQNQDIFLHPSVTSPTRENLSSSLENWMTWLQHKETNSVKSSHSVEGQVPSRMPPPPRYHCDACSKTYSTFGGLSKHRQFHCSRHVKKEFACKVCSRAYSSLGALKMHIRTHTLPCRCLECGKAFSRPWLLQGHLRTHTGEKPFKCSHCGRAFADRSNLRAHLQTHAEIKRYACSKCGKTFSRMSLLSKHTEGSCTVNIRNK